MPHATDPFPLRITDATLVVERDHPPFKFDMMNLDGPTVKTGQQFPVTLSFAFKDANISPEDARKGASISSYLSKYTKVGAFDGSALAPNCLVKDDTVKVTIDERVALREGWIGLKFETSLCITGEPGFYELSFAASLNRASVRDHTIIINVCQ
jgi:hypothetical protein